LKLWGNLEFGGEFEGLALVELHLSDIGATDEAQVFLLHTLLKEAGDQVFEHLLADIAPKLVANPAGGGLSGPKAGDLGLLLERGNDFSRFSLHLFHRDRNL